MTSFVWSHLNSYQSCHPHTFESSCTKVLQDLFKATRTSAQILHRWIEDWTRPAWLFLMVDGSHNIEYLFINAFIWLLSTWDGRSSPSGSLEKRSGLPSIQTFFKILNIFNIFNAIWLFPPLASWSQCAKIFPVVPVVTCHTMSHHVIPRHKTFQSLNI